MLEFYYRNYNLSSRNKPKMAYSCDIPKMARQQFGIIERNCSDT